MPSTELFGYAAAIMTTTAFAPQAWLTWKSRRVEGVSLGMYSILTIGTLLWLTYGLQIGAWPVVIANAITLVLTVFILSMKIRYG